MRTWRVKVNNVYSSTLQLKGGLACAATCLACCSQALVVSWMPDVGHKAVVARAQMQHTRFAPARRAKRPRAATMSVNGRCVLHAGAEPDQNSKGGQGWVKIRGVPVSAK
ncbi:hypothetical protein PR003_g30556 [Phytophthora rubi]|uniref:Uncharacterized protein n=1 Tax=Phytophthora rubi TaxID=129364 RepID=A0A6A4BGI0_9STRA|nr:hypothetical protein PR002_g29376 [Phytophthora rubi]KAE9271289.1 hypothetical protein PR003_g30556 [Phytophthora rubi]